MHWSRPTFWRSRGRLKAAIATATVALLAATSPVQALSLGAPTPLATALPSHNGSLTASGGSYVHVVFAARASSPTRSRTMYRRSVDGGATWLPAIELSRPGTEWNALPAVSVASATVDVVWTEGTFEGGPASVWYRRSEDSGATWAAAVRISPLSVNAVDRPAVARQGSTVLVSYTDMTGGTFHFRRSVDGGATWHAVRTLGTTATLNAEPSHLAFGGGVLYAAWQSTGDSISLRRSFDAGLTWTGTGTIPGRFPRIAAFGSEALMTLTLGERAVVRRTSDKGSHWAAPQRVSRTDQSAASGDVRYVAGRYRLVYAACIDNCQSEALFYRESIDGSRWTWPLRFSIAGHEGATAIGIGYTSATGKTWLGWNAYVQFGGLNGTIFVRSVE
jgi:hypothetical protein